MIRWIVRLSFGLFLLFALWVVPEATHGFRLGKLALDGPSVAEAFQPSLNRDVFSKPFRYLGHGGQCYVFENEDKTFVLKIFRKSLSPHPLRNWFRKHLLKKNPRGLSNRKIQRLLTSSQIASELAPDLTGVYFAHLSQTEKILPQATLIDRIGRRHHLDLNRCRFVLQKKGSLIWDVFSDEKILDQFVEQVKKRVARKIRNTDVKVSTNFGVVDGQVVEWDIGSFVLDESLADPLMAAQEVERFYAKMRHFLAKKAPQFLAYFEERTAE